MISWFYKSPSPHSKKKGMGGLALNTWYRVAHQFAFNSTWSSFDFNLLHLELIPYTLQYNQLHRCP